MNGSFFLFFQSHVNHFTGTVYQSVLLSQKQLLRAVSTDESAQPNTSPAQWPGKSRRIFCLIEEKKAKNTDLPPCR